MQRKLPSGLYAGVLLVAFLISQPSAMAQGTAFTYQCYLTQNGSVLNGSYDLQFLLFDANTGGTQLGGTLTTTAASIRSGLYTALLDFGPGIFKGQPCWLQIAIRSSGAGAYTLLTRQPLTPTPSAIFAGSSGGSAGGQWLTSGSDIYYNNGNVGIGTASMYGTLDVRGIFGLFGGGLSGSPYERFDLRATTDGLFFYAPQAADVGRLPYHFGWTGSGSDAMTILGNGNVGIGTASPSGSLHVLSAGPAQLFLERIGAVTGKYRLGVAGANNTFYIQDEAANGGTPRLVIDAKGSIGIGTTTPDANVRLNVLSSGFDSAVQATHLVGNYAVLGGRNDGVYGAAGGALGQESYAVSGYHEKGAFGALGAPVNFGGDFYASAGVYGHQGDNDEFGYAGLFKGYVETGPLSVLGTLHKTGGSFKIDHPLHPDEKYLYHSFVESPDMKNIYDGVVELNANGEAEVPLPDWFQALNRDFRYQLTAIGAPGPNLHIAEKIQDNKFKIAGGSPNMEVSWQVTGIRQDAWANAHRIPVEEDKPATERGTYIAPAEHGQPKEKGVGFESRQRMRGRKDEPRLSTRSGPRQ